MPAVNPPAAAAGASWRRAALFALGAVGCFQAAYGIPVLGVLIFGYVICLGQLARLERPLHVFGVGLVVGLACVAPQLAFFYGIFGPPAISLWVILAAWTALFVTLLHLVRRRWGTAPAAWLTPFLWTGLEYFRSEIYYLRFSWLNVGYALGPAAPLRWLGMYGVGFAGAGLAAWISLRCPRPVVALALATATILLPRLAAPAPRWLEIAGLQMELASPRAVLENLDALAHRCPQAPLYVMSEYTFDGGVPDTVKTWCRDHGKYLIAGGKTPVGADQFRNTAFVVGPTGTVEFSQAKSVPIQLFSDGLPAAEQRLWDSPWGKIGICICYDLSYRRVTDRLAALGANAIIVPTMDAISWGEHEHQLHSRVAPVRAAEYGIPAFRLASSGISQAVDGAGAEIARAPFPGDGAVLSARLDLSRGASLPVDRWLAPAAVGVTGLVALGLLVAWATGKEGPNYMSVKDLS